MNKSILRILPVALLVLLNFRSNAQQLSSYNLQFLPQRSYMNPSFIPPGKVHVGIPVVSGISYAYSNNGFRYSDLFRKNENNTLILDMGNTIDQLQSRNSLSLDAEAELLAIGMKAGKNYFTLNVTEKAGISFNFSKSLMEFLYEGNAATTGTVQQFTPEFNGIHYREYGLTWAREISAVITAGLHVKYLYGMEHAVTKGTGVTVYTDPVDYSITATSDFTILTSGLDTGSFNNTGFGNYSFGKQNRGYAVDAGLTIRPLPTIEISASAIDLGKINWSDNNANYHTNTGEGSFVYEGINLDEFINNDTMDAESYLQAIGDSLYECFNVSTTTESYTSKIPMKIYLGATYHITPRFKLTALARNKSTYHGNHTDYHFGFTGKSKTWLNYTIGLNKINKTPVTIGAGGSVNFGNYQLYFVSDNIPGVINWKKSYNTGFRAGINIVLGTRLKYRKAPQPALDAPPATP